MLGLFDNVSEGEWRRFYALLKRRLSDGTLARGDLMRRWDGERWVYRRETPDETLNRVDDHAW